MHMSVGGSGEEENAFEMGSAGGLCLKLVMEGAGYRNAPCFTRML